MAQPIEPLFNYAYDVMLERAGVFHDRLEAELASFTAKFPWLDAVWLAAFLADIGAADAFPTDEEVTLDIKVLTGDVRGAMQQGYAGLNTLGVYAKLTWPNDLARQRVFGQQKWAKSRNSTLKLQECLELAHTKADTAAYKGPLLLKGYTQPQIDQLGTLADELGTKNRLQEAAKAGRKVSSHDRVALLNIVWQHMQTINVCAAEVWANDAERQAQYELYPGGSGGNADNGTVNITGTVTAQTSGAPLDGAKLTLVDEADPGTLLAQFTTGPDGKYTLTVEDLSDPFTAKLEVVADGYTAQAAQLSIEPGQDISGQDFSLPDAP